MRLQPASVIVLQEPFPYETGIFLDGVKYGFTSVRAWFSFSVSNEEYSYMTKTTYTMFPQVYERWEWKEF